MVLTKRPSKELVELHFHLGQSVEPHILWAIAHEQGIKLPTKDYWEFYDMITLNKKDVTWDDYHKLFHWTELIQSSPVSMERTVYEVVTGAYRAGNISLLEPSFNPMFRNRGGERDLDQILLAALRGMERALVEFPQVRAGLILLLDRRLPFEKNAIVARKAIKYRSRGIVGIDIAGPRGDGFKYEDYSKLYDEVREAGIKTTVHTGEDGDVAEMEHVLKVLKLDRLNHGFRAYESKPLMKEVVKRNLTMCLCPTSSLVLKFIKDLKHLDVILNTLYDNDVKFCLNTDNPSMLKTSLAKECALVLDNKILTAKQIDQTMKWASEASFIPTEPGRNLYL